MKRLRIGVFLLAIVSGAITPVFGVPPGSVFSIERFNYPVDSNLNGNGGWSGSAGAEIKIVPQPAGESYPAGQYCVSIAEGAGSKDAAVTLSYSGVGGIIWVHFLVRGNPSPPSGAFWRVWLDDTSGNNLACWVGTSSTCKGTIGGSTPATAETTFYNWGFNDFCCKIDTNANTSEFFLNYFSMGTLNHGSAPGNSLGRVRLERIDNASAAGWSIFFDELIIGYRVNADPPPFQRNGQPYFPIGIYHYPGGNDAAHLQELSDAGFNVVRRPIISLTTTHLDTAQSYGINILAEASSWLGNSSTYLSQIQTKIAQIKNHPALVGYETMDEPYWNWVRFAGGYSREALTTGRALFNQLDPNHPVWCNYAPYDLTSQDGVIPLTFEGYQQWTSVGNVYGMDRYPVWYGWDDLNPVNYDCDVLRQIAGEGKSVYMVLQGCAMFDWAPPTTWARPTWVQTRFMGYSSIIHGAKGILYWGQYYIEPTSQLWTDIKRFASEIKYLNDVLSAGVTSPGYSLSDSQCEAIMKIHNGDRYLIVANRTASAKTGVSVQVPGWGASTTRVLFEDGRTIASPTASWTDDFEAWGVHVYTDQLPPDDPPGVARSLSSSVCGSNSALNWTNPIDKDFTGTMIRWKSDSYPTSPTDGALVVDQPGAPGAVSAFTHTDRPEGVAYYSLFAHDSAPHYSSAANIAEVIGPAVNEPFDSYSDGDLGGLGNWTTTGAASAQVQSAVAKTGKSVLMDTVPSGLNIANEISFPARTSGYHTVTLDVAQDAVGTTGRVIGYVTFYASDSATEVTRLQITKGRLLVDYNSGSAILTSSAVNLTWYSVTIGFDVSARRFDLWLDGSSKGQGYLWKGTGANLSRIVISSDRNTSLNPQKAYLDNLTLEKRPSAVSSVTDDGGWTPSLSKLHFTFGLSPCADQHGYSIGTTSGGTNVRGWTSCQGADMTATGLSLTENQNYYISVRAGTGHGTWSPSVSTNGIKVAPGVGIQQAKGLPDGAANEVKALRGKVVSAVFQGCFYLQDPIGPGVSPGPFGIKIVSSASVQPGDEVDVCGVMRGAGGERYLDCAGNGIFIGPGILPGPVGLNSFALGGSRLNPYTPGVVAGIGLNNIGLYVRLLGRVTQRSESEPKYYYIDDGCGLRDGTTTGTEDNVGVRVSGDPASYPAGSYVVVNGISSCFDDAGRLKRQVLPVFVEIIGP